MSHEGTEKCLSGDESSSFRKESEKSPEIESRCPGDEESKLETPSNAAPLVASNPWHPSIGVFQSYYQLTYLHDYLESDISWIGSLGVFIMLAGGLVVGRLYDMFGPRPLIFAGTFFHVFGLMMASMSTKYYQFILSQGICSPIGICLLVSPATNSAISWFFKKRAFAVGLVAAGSGLGGTILPIMINKLIPQVGFGWAMRIAAFLQLALLILANLTVRSRVPPRPKPLNTKRFFSPLTEKSFVLLIAGSSVYYLGLFLPINYIQHQAIRYGMDSSLAIYIIPILNVGSIIGRVLPTFIADKLGRFNTNMVMAFVAALLSLGLWLPATGDAPLIVFAILYGAASGTYIALLPAMMAHISDNAEIGHRIGFGFALLSIPALIGNPIGGAILAANHGEYRNMQIYTGVLLFVGGCLFVATRFSVVGMKLCTRG
ncbi:major facilitator superfamily transporter 1 [Venturia nashicola]|nr:major facilitator superfamily transporter 1 [Venturia nashicola]